MSTPLTLVAPTCACCEQPSALLPRDDLPGGLAVCPASGLLHRPEGQRYLPTSLPDLRPAAAPVSVRIDLSRSGYA